MLDIDETLIHSVISPSSSYQKVKQDVSNKEVNPFESGCEQFHMKLSDGENVLVRKRPGLDRFLQLCSEKYEVMAYTAGLRQYAEPLLDWLDPSQTIFSHKLYRDSCLFSNGYYVKDLSKLNRCLKRTVLVDNNICCFLPQLANGIPIASFYDDPKDNALDVLLMFLKSIEDHTDVRVQLNKSFNLVKSLAHTREHILG